MNRRYYYAYTTCQLQGEDTQVKRYLTKQIKKGNDGSTKIAVSGTKKGTVAGAVALIVGTSIGSGILALPMKTSPAVTWFFDSMLMLFQISTLKNRTCEASKMGYILLCF